MMLTIPGVNIKADAAKYKAALLRRQITSLRKWVDDVGGDDELFDELAGKHITALYELERPVDP